MHHAVANISCFHDLWKSTKGHGSGAAALWGKKFDVRLLYSQTHTHIQEPTSTSVILRV